TIVSKGECHGHITEEPRGSQGFGYDPVFMAEGFDKTFGELGPEIKNGVSHRAKALEELERILEDREEK
ncbi:MAG: non-canonical purine NTP pyrophosphatase, partial [Firmicutes bacterium]|nr:non-canonical purine NTP pyrophosphatase [Bacillota bacterium]